MHWQVLCSHPAQMQTDKSGNPDTERLCEVKGKQTPECQAIHQSCYGSAAVKAVKVKFPQMGTQF
jgi:hypothetical protein